METAAVRDFTRLHRDIAFGRAQGRVIWQPRILCWLYDKRFAGEALPEPYEGMTLPEIYRSLGCSARPYREFNASIRRIPPDALRRTERDLNETDVEIRIETPVGTQVAVERRTANSDRRIRLKWPVSNEDELKIAIWIAENSSFAWDQAAYDQALKDWAGLGAPTVHVPRITIQDLYLNTMGVEGTIFALQDYPDTVEAYMNVLVGCHDRLLDLLIDSPIEILNFGDNVHCGTLPPNLFRKYVLPEYQRRSAKLHAAGKFIHAHWDGDTKALLPLARETGLDGIEAITPKPQGDVTLEEMKAGLGDEMFLIDGLPAVLFDNYFPPSALEEFTRRLVEMFAPRLILGISDELSSTGDIERIRLVGRIVEEYNEAVSG